LNVENTLVYFKLPIRGASEKQTDSQRKTIVVWMTGVQKEEPKRLGGYEEEDA